MTNAAYGECRRHEVLQLLSARLQQLRWQLSYYDR
jgi:hypothetical protein